MPEERVERDETGRTLRRFFVEGEVLEGEFITYGEGGWVAQKCVFKSGLLDGELMQYDEDGELAAVMSYKSGALDGESKFFSRGRLELTSGWKDGKQEGETTVFGPNGKPTTKAEWQKGKLHGISSWFRPDGTLMRTQKFVEGNPDGPPVEHDERGKPLKG